MRAARPLLALLLVALAACGRPVAAPPAADPTSLAKEAGERDRKNLFANPRARASLPDVDRFAPSTPEDAAAAANPRIWRRLDRARRYDGVLLAGPLAEIQPLLAHLASSPDFRLVDLTPAGVLFTRESATPFGPRPPAEVARNDGAARGLALVRMALLLDAAGDWRAARDYAATARTAAPRDADVAVGLAVLAYAQKDYPRAMAEAGRGMEIRPDDLGALEVMARTLAVTGNTDAAWEIATELKSRANPEDMNVLFLHARLANAARAFSAEQDSLERLIALAEKAGLPSGDYRVYLGQCYARLGLARPALEQLETAARDPNLSAEQRADLDTAIATVRARAGTLSN